MQALSASWHFRSIRKGGPKLISMKLYSVQLTSYHNYDILVCSDGKCLMGGPRNHSVTCLVFDLMNILNGLRNSYLEELGCPTRNNSPIKIKFIPNEA